MRTGRAAWTRLPNAAVFRDTCDRELKRARHFGRPLTLILVEIGDLPRIVESHGKQAA